MSLSSSPLEAIIQQAITEAGSLSFENFMQLALYHPYYGYYTKGDAILGRQGDFVTAPLLTPLFGYAVANAMLPYLLTHKKTTILELGAGNGQLCVDILTRLAALDNLPMSYTILDVSEGLTRIQKQHIEKHIPHLAHLVTFIRTLPPQFEGIILANEVMDALPCRRFYKDNHRLYEGYVTLNDEGVLTEIFDSPSDEHIALALGAQYDTLPEPYASEVITLIKPWLKSLADTLTSGLIFLFDYGFHNAVLYHPDRDTGTLMCHYRQQAHPNPFIHIGDQDITAHVDFSFVAHTADALGMNVSAYVNLMSFLIYFDILSLSQLYPDKYMAGLNIVLNPAEMGEIFKVMILSKGVDDTAWQGMLSDRRGVL